MNKYDALVEIVRLLHRKSPFLALAAILVVCCAPVASTIAIGAVISMIAEN